jgi:hypothetical protein
MMNAEQKAAWLSARAGKLTASRMRDAMDYLKTGASSAARTKLLHSLLAERLTGFSTRNVVTPAMQDGLDYEDEMFDFFVERTGRKVHMSRLYEHPTIENLAATPDRELDDGLMEGKVPQPETFVRWTLAGVIPPEHMPQMAAQCLCSGRRWVGFVAYCPWIKDEGKRLFMRKFEPAQEYLDTIEREAIKFLGELDDLFDRFVSSTDEK